MNCGVYFTFIALIVMSLTCLSIITYVHALNVIGGNPDNTFVNSSNDVSGIYLSNTHQLYILKQVNNSIWLVGSNTNNTQQISNIFSGIMVNNSKIIGKWISYPLTNNSLSGNTDFNLKYYSKDNITLINLSTGNVSYPVNTLYKYDATKHRPLNLYISMDNIVLNQGRSPTSDILYVGIGAKKNNENPIIATQYLGQREDGSNITTILKVGPFILNPKDTITVDLLGLDRAGSRTPFILTNLGDSLNQLLDPSYTISNLIDATDVVNSISPGLIPGGCNGLVFADKFELPFDILKNSTDSIGKFSKQMSYLGTSSPPGCGSISQYKVTLSTLPS